MSLADTNQFFDALRTTRLLDDARLDELRTRPEVLWGELDKLTQYLTDQALLTPFQVQELRAGRGARLVVGGYRLLGSLGSDPSGDSFKALHPALAQPVQLRFIHPDWLAPADNIDDYVARTQAACVVNHPHLANILDAGQHDGAPFIVQEYIDGCDLLRLVREMGALPVSLACGYVRQATLALQEAAHRNIWHGSVGPHTLWLTPVKRVVSEQGTESVRPRSGATAKLLNLGLAPRRPPLRSFVPADLSPQGSIEFVAPEFLQLESPTATGDIYALGATLYFLLAGRSPITGNSIPEILGQFEFGNPASIEYLRTDLPMPIAILVGRMLSRDPASRPTLSEISETLLPHAEVIVPPVSPPLAVPVASETMSIPNIPTAMIVPELAPIAETMTPNVEPPIVEAMAPTIEPMPEVHPLDDHHHGHEAFGHHEQHGGHEDHFDHSTIGADQPAAPRPKKPVTSSHKMWIVLGLCLHMIATLMCLSFFNILPNPFAPSPPEPKQEVKPEPKKKKSNNKTVRD